MLQVEEPLQLRLLQHDHGVCLSEEGARCSYLPHFNELHHHLLKRLELIRWCEIQNEEDNDNDNEQFKAHLLVKINKYVIGQL